MQIQPVGSKTTGWTIGGDMECPTEVYMCVYMYNVVNHCLLCSMHQLKESPYFYTEQNSNNQADLLRTSYGHSKSFTEGEI